MEEKLALFDVKTHDIVNPRDIRIEQGMVINLYGPKGEHRQNAVKWLNTIRKGISQNTMNEMSKIYSFVIIRSIDGRLVAIPYYDTYVDKDIFINNSESGFTYSYLDREAYPDTLGFNPSLYCGFFIESVYQGIGSKQGNKIYEWCLC